MIQKVQLSSVVSLNQIHSIMLIDIDNTISDIEVEQFYGLGYEVIKFDNIFLALRHYKKYHDTVKFVVTCVKDTKEIGQVLFSSKELEEKEKFIFISEKNILENQELINEENIIARPLNFEEISCKFAKLY